MSEQDIVVDRSVADFWTRKQMHASSTSRFLDYRDLQREVTVSNKATIVLGSIPIKRSTQDDRRLSP